MLRPLVSSLVVAGLLAAAPAFPRDVPAFESGYRSMYALDFPAADRQFLVLEHEDPDDPLAPVSRAANLLFRELDRLGILQTEFFQDNSAFTSSPKPVADPAVGRQLEMFLARGEKVASDRLARNARDADALFALTLAEGLRADYAALIEGRNFASLAYTRQASAHARALLAIAPGYYDAYLATGISQYIVGSLPAPVRWLLRVGGYQGDRRKGMEELTVTAERGRLLGPFARILLAVGYLREGNRTRARELLEGLRREFPSNPLFGRELDRLSTQAHPEGSSSR